MRSIHVGSRWLSRATHRWLWLAAASGSMACILPCLAPTSAYGANILMVGANGEPSFGDDGAVFDYLSGVLSHDVTYLAGDAATTEDGEDVDLIVISSTLASGNARGKFLNLPTPILNWEEAIMDGTTAAGNFAMGAGSENGTAELGTQIRIINPDHPLAAGLSGVVEIATTPIPRSYVSGNLGPGVLGVAGFPNIGQVELSPSGQGMHLGTSQTGGNRFVGKMDEMAVWSQPLSFVTDASGKLTGGDAYAVYTQGGAAMSGAGGLEGWWSFNDAAADMATDGSQNGFDAQLLDAAKDRGDGAPGVGGNVSAVLEEGVGTIDIAAMERPGGALAYSFWFKPDGNYYGPTFDTADPRADFFYGNGANGTTVRPHLSANRNGRPVGLYVNSNGDLATPIEAVTSSFASDEWHNVMITWDGDVGSVFINGRLDNQVRLNSTQQYSITAVDAGGALTDGTEAPGRRVNFPIQDVGFASLTDDGLKLFDAAVNWLLGTGAQPGDFNSDGSLSVVDINLLLAAVKNGANGSPYNLTGAGNAVDQEDINYWVASLKKTWLGDANLDGQFDSGDFVTVFQAGLFEQNLTAGWEQGDWNGDQRFDSGDFIVAFQGGGFEQGPRAAVSGVPEPASATMTLLLGAVAAATLRRNRAGRGSPIGR